MMRALRLAVVGIIGISVGALGALAVDARPSSRASAVSAPSTEQPTTTVPPLPSKVPVSTAPVLLVWTQHELPADFTNRVRALAPVQRLTEIKGDSLELATSTPSMVIPIDAIAFDPTSYPSFVDPAARSAFAHLQAGEALLSATSAQLRHAAAGMRLTFASGQTVTVAAIIDDVAMTGAELAVTAPTGQELGVTTSRSLLIAYDGERDAIEQAIRAVAPPDPMRFRAPGETPYLRRGDAVLPQALIKDAFGEFSYTRTDGKAITIDPAWVTANIVTADVPILGSVRCHRMLIPALSGAMRELEQDGLASLVDPKAFTGCWVPVLLSTTGAPSRHAWGAAVDLNFRSNPTGVNSVQDPRLVEILERWGFTWGGRWLVPDPSYFEYLRPP